MSIRNTASKWVVLAVAAGTLAGAGPAATTTPATTRPGEAATRPATNQAAPELTVRQRNLLLQLSDAEASIQAINTALRRAGYRVGQAYDRIDSNLKGNEIMDRKGGGPVRWDEFYGKTASSFVMHDAGSPVYHQVQRPKQFDFIYRANNDQVSRAREQISTVAQDQATLLARRQKHEVDQSLLWATIAWEQVKDREIEFHPLCRFALKPKNAQAAALRPVILFLRVADRVAADGLEGAQADQAGALLGGNKRLGAAFAALQSSLADALEAGGLTPDQRKQGQALKAMCRGLADTQKVICDNYANALDRDRAKNQDTSKLEFRRDLQKSLAEYAFAVGKLDDEIAATAEAWGVEADRGTPTPDTLPDAGARRDAGVAQKSSPATLAEVKSDDPVQVGTVWTGTQPVNHRLTITERNGEHVKARFEVGPRIVRIISGTVKDGAFSWLAKDVQAVQGAPGDDNTGVIRGDQIDFTWGPEKRHFTLTLDKASSKRADAGPGDREGGWVDLFNGTDLSGWEAVKGRFGDADWRVVNGVITGTGKSGFLSTKAQYGNFELRVEARVATGGNSGIFFRAIDPVADKGGYQSQISDSTDGDPMKTGSIRYYGKRHQGKPIEMIVKKSPVGPGEWFTTEIVANGAHVVIKINGRETVDFTDSDNLPARGRVALECYHCDSIEFRRVQIRELPATQK